MTEHTVDEWKDAVEALGEPEPLYEAPKPAPIDTMNYDSLGSHGPGVYCTCGAYKAHPRGKVLVKWVNRHGAKTGHKWKGVAES